MSDNFGFFLFLSALCGAIAAMALSDDPLVPAYDRCIVKADRLACAEAIYGAEGKR